MIIRSITRQSPRVLHQQRHLLFPSASASSAPARLSRILSQQFTSSVALKASHAPDVSLDPQSELAAEWFQRGGLAWQNGDLEQALECFEKSHWSKPNANALFNVGNVFHSMGRHEKAIDAWKRSLNLDPNRADAHVNIGSCYALILKDFTQAIHHLEKATQLDPTDGEIRFNLGAILDAAGKIETAVEEYALAEKHGVDRAKQTLRNARAKLLASKVSQSDGTKQT